MNLPLWKLSLLRRRLFEWGGSDRYSRPAYNGMDSRLESIFQGPGFFVEAGAVDGVFESNTYYLERFKGWSGLLIEPIPEMHARIALNRPKSISYNCALVPFRYSGEVVSINSAHALSSIKQSRSQVSATIDVPARTLSSVLEESKAPEVDLLSLDVEGFEIEVLNGLDFSKHAPKYILIEALDEDFRSKIERYLVDRYMLFEILSYRDFLFKRRDI